ncbi:hypothetical protein A3A11_00480 [Candidatus Nomurabacteria bacterium RIFCSPLOWO2_01_FULL_43_15]|nr:MAG: hypothetical protein A3A11_00480 [Candidatus Nomurabacteria bacterium RIFCSPLOWO2_01_FULL_43_15]
MKKYIVFLFVFAFIFGLLNVNFINAQNSSVGDCLPGDLFSRLTGERCSTITTPTECRPGHLFSSITGKPCKRTTPPIVCPIFKIGTKGENVRAFQAQLNAQGANLKLDGSYGSLTQSSALRYCKPPTGGPVISGISGSQTLNVNQQGTWIVKAYDSSGGNLSYSVLWGDEELGPQNAPLTSSPLRIETQKATFTHSYYYTGSFTPTFYVTNSSGQRTQASLSVKVEDVTDKIVSEQIKCVFSGSRTTQSCYTTNRAGKEYTFSGTETAQGTISGYNGEILTWKSSCGGYAYTTMDREDEYARFNCTDDSSSITVLSPNGGETWVKGTTQTIRWQDNRTTTCKVGSICPSPTYDIKLFSYNSPCTTNICPRYYPTPEVRTIATGVYGSSYQWTIPNCAADNTCSSNFDIAAGSYMIEVCQAGTKICDSSNSYFKIVDSGAVSEPIDLGTLSINPDPVTITAGSSGQVQAFYASGCSSGLVCPKVVQEVDATWSVENNSIANVMYAKTSCPLSTAFTCESKTYISVYGVSPGATELTAKYADNAGRTLTKTIFVYVLGTITN